MLYVPQKENSEPELVYIGTFEDFNSILANESDIYINSGREVYLFNLDSKKLTIFFSKQK